LDGTCGESGWTWSCLNLNLRTFNVYFLFSTYRLIDSLLTLVNPTFYDVF
jgi:hypothetical protein